MCRLWKRSQTFSGLGYSILIRKCKLSFLLRVCYNGFGDTVKKIGGIAILIIILDQIIKYLFCNTMELGESIILLPQFFSFTLVKNTGVAFSLFAGSQIPLIILAILVVIILFIWIQKQTLTPFNILSYGLLYGGIIGNLIDRIIRHGVVDYLDFTILGYPFPIFNLADICVVCGAFLLTFTIWKEDEK